MYIFDIDFGCFCSSLRDPCYWSLVLYEYQTKLPLVPLKPFAAPRPRLDGRLHGMHRAGIGTVGARVPNASVYITGLPRDVIQAKIGEQTARQVGLVNSSRPLHFCPSVALFFNREWAARVQCRRM